MKTKYYLLLLILPLSFLPVFAETSAPADSAAADSAGLNKGQVKNLYFEGDFTTAKGQLEQFIKSIKDTEDNDLIFAYKYLSVIYAANPETEELAKNYMYKLVTLSPTIEILDLHPSDKIQAMFNSVKENYAREQKYKESYDEVGKPKESQSEMESGAAEETVKPEQKKDNRKLYIFVGGGVAVAAVVTLFILLSGDDTQEKTVATVNL
jgi:hypothetical protein